MLSISKFLAPACSTTLVWPCRGVLTEGSTVPHVSDLRQGLCAPRCLTAESGAGVTFSFLNFQEKALKFFTITGQTMESFVKSLDGDVKELDSDESQFVFALAGIVTSK